MDTLHVDVPSVRRRPEAHGAAPSGDRVGDPEEVFVCDLCGVVTRTRPQTCPACGAGHG